jgi:hypothetical protein
MPNKVLEGFGYAAIAAFYEANVPPPTNLMHSVKMRN